MVKTGLLFDKSESALRWSNMMKYPFSLVIITLNEERNIERCIRSVPFASEILVVDSGSTDKTCEIAKSLGARVISHPWNGYGLQKRFATKQAQFDWILSLDADEVLSPELAEEFQKEWPTLKPEIGYEMPRKSFHLGKWIEHGGWYPDYQLRLYHRKFSNWPEAQIHERVEAEAIERFANPIQHFVFANLSAQVLTNDQYSSLLAGKDFQAGKKFRVSKLIFKPWSKFFECYFWKLGFLDGLPGLIIAVSAGYSIFLRWAKIWELEMKQKKGISSK
jgi:glycosyltransferase involved in cell wall biosynthesis